MTRTSLDGIPSSKDLSSEDFSASVMSIEIGPAHPAMHGIVRFTTHLDGELIVGMDAEIGYLHRGFEKESENSKWIQVIAYTDRLNYVSPLLNNIGYSMAVEKLYGIEAPLRAEYTRVIMGEISPRITQSTQVNIVTNIKLANDILQFLVIKCSIF